MKDAQPIRTRVTQVDFAVPAGAAIGERFDSWSAAVDFAGDSIQRFTFKGQTVQADAPDYHPKRYFQEGDTLVVYSRAFVQMRVAEPIQDRANGIRDGSDHVAMTWEVFSNGTIEAVEQNPRAADLLAAKDVRLVQLEADIADLKIERAQLRSHIGNWNKVIRQLQPSPWEAQAEVDNGFIEDAQPENSTPVDVYGPGSDKPLFSGQRHPTAPWSFWSRVYPDGGYVDLPPVYRIERKR